MDNKVLVVYYSLEGNTKLIAEAIAKESAAEILRLKPVKEIPSRGFFKYFIGGMKAMFKAKCELQSYAVDPSQYDTIFIGTPVWASRTVPALRTFLALHKLNGKKIAAFCTYMGNEGKSLENILKLTQNSTHISKKGFKMLPDIKSQSIEHAVKWASSLKDEL